MATAPGLTKTDVQGLCQRYWSEEKPEPKPGDKDCENAPKVLSFELKPVSETPSGFLSFPYFLNVTLTKNTQSGGESTEKVRFFAKMAPIGNESRMHYIDEFRVFEKEIYLYRDLLPAIQAIIPGIVPKCFYAANSSLIFEDLSLQGHKMGAGRNGLLDYKHLLLAVKNLAALHAGSIIYEVRKGKMLNEMFGAVLEENAYPINVSQDHIRIKNFTKATEVMLEIIKVIPKFEQNLDFILKEVPKRMRKIFELAQTSSKYRNVLCHADLWANNIMFQYDDMENKPTQCRFVDFQLARYAPPMLDLITVLTIPTSRIFRAKYLTELINEFYNFMREFLKTNGLKIEDYLPRDDFDKSFNEFRVCGLIESILFSHLVILPPQSTQNLTGSTNGFEDFFDKKRIEICMKAFNSDKIYRDRLTDMIEDFVDKFVL